MEKSWWEQFLILLSALCSTLDNSLCRSLYILFNKWQSTIQSSKHLCTYFTNFLLKFLFHKRLLAKYFKILCILRWDFLQRHLLMNLKEDLTNEDKSEPTKGLIYFDTQHTTLTTETLKLNGACESPVSWHVNHWEVGYSEFVCLLFNLKWPRSNVYAKSSITLWNSQH